MLFTSPLRLSWSSLACFPRADRTASVFQAPWDKILQAVDATAQSHHQLAANIDRDVEAPLRAFGTKPEMQEMIATSGNLSGMARDLDEAQKKVETLGKKGTKGNAQKLEAALSKLNSSTQQWDSSAPFIFESLQALDEQRVNQLRDLLTQYQTHESDQAQRSQATAAETLASMLEISTELEIASFQERATAGRPRLEKRPSTRQTSHTAAGQGQSQSLAPPNHSQIADDTTSERSVPVEHRPPPPPEPKQETKQEGKTGMRSRTRERDVPTWPTDPMNRIQAAQSHRHHARPPTAKCPQRLRVAFPWKVWILWAHG